MRAGWGSGREVGEDNELSPLQLLGAPPSDPGGKGETGRAKGQVDVRVSDGSLGDGRGRETTNQGGSLDRKRKAERTGGQVYGYMGSIYDMVPKPVGR